MPAPAVAGLKELPETPGPDQEPVMPLCVVFSAMGKKMAQNGPMGVRAGVVIGVMVMVNNGFGLHPEDGSKM